MRALLAVLLLTASLAGCGSTSSAPLVDEKPLEGAKSPVVALAVAPRHGIVARSGDGTIRIWPLAGGAAPRVVRPEGLAGSGAALKVATTAEADAPGLARLGVPNDQLLALRGDEIVVSVADPPLWEELKPQQVRRFALAFLSLPGGKAGSVWTFDEKWGAPVALAWSPAGPLAVAFSDAKIRIFARDRSQLAELPTFKNRSQVLAKYDALPAGVHIANEARVVRALAFSPDGQTLAGAMYLPDGGTRCHLVLWKQGPEGFLPERGEVVRVPDAPEPRRLGDLREEEAPMVSALAFSPDGQQIACSGFIFTGRPKTVAGVVNAFGLKTAEVFGRAWIVSARNGVIAATIDGEIDAPIASAAFLSVDEVALAAFGSLRIFSLATNETRARRSLRTSIASAYALDQVFRFDAADHGVPVLAVIPPAIYVTEGARIAIVTPPSR